MLMPKTFLFLFFSVWSIGGVCPAADPPITGVAFAPDAKSVVVCSQAGVAVYSWPDLTLQSTLKTSSPNIHDLAFSPRGNRLAVAGGTPAEAGTIEIFAWPGGASLALLAGHTDLVMDVCWIDQTTLGSASLDHNVRIWSIEKGESIHTLQGHSRGVSALDHLDGQDILVSAGIDQSLRVWNWKSGELVRCLAIHVKPVNSVLRRPAKEGLRMIASASDDRSVRFWQPTIGRMVRFARLPSEPRDISWVPDGNRIVACCSDGHVYVIDPNTVEVVDDIPVTDDWAYCVAVHPSDGSLVIGGVDGSIKRFALP
jgi:WD40 repeat protein